MTAELKKNSVKRNKKEIVRFIISFILSFMVAIVLTFTAFMVSIYFGFLNQNTILGSLEKREFYNQVQEYFYENAKDITIPTGLPEEVLDDIVKLRQVYGDVNTYLSACLNGTEYKIDSSNVTKKLKEQVEAYYKSQNKEMTKEQKSALDTYASSIAQEYERDVKIPVVQYYSTIKGILKKVILVSLAFTLVFVLFTYFIISKIHRHRQDGIRFFVYSSLAGMLMTGIIPAVLLISRYYTRLNIRPEYFYQFAMNYFEKGMLIILYFSAGLGVMSICGMLLIRFLKGKALKGFR